ncbi:CPBP family intramembrane glutamic endopeptidase [Papillibacter cinnamivorans]|uniref:CAAX protease self-immunity n=1 Tax=Papillibacter cinnamivorans DSM 12816 TaxID=1122930 RepID=A0A1W1YX05_9FIRM|nr:type II CAAX endopeptidase family protein [Papillibacter cinnamivorans]SMC40737.1 CAAX protease self-immunity [Papillibacter cinnamivorans DSM 12816]
METERKTERKRLCLFLVLTFAVSWPVFLLTPITGQSYGSAMSIVFTMCAMFVPSLCNILTRIITKEGFGKLCLRPNFKGHVKAYVLIYFLPAALLLISGTVYFLVFPGSFDPELTALQQIAALSGKTGFTADRLLLISILQIVLIGPVINIIPTLGEELGWRGYLLPKLRLFLSDRAALTVTGVIWGLWHTPVIVLGHNYGTGYPGYPWLGILAMIVFCFGLGVLEGYISIRMKSVIPAAMIHSAVNAGAAMPVYMMKGSYYSILGPALTGFVGGIPMTVLAVILLIKTGRGGLGLNGETRRKSLTTEEK